MNQQKHNDEISGFILAGGKSSRMGSDKGLLHLRDKPLIQWVINELAYSIKQCFIISDNPSYKQFDLPLIGDKQNNLGPAGGIFTALCASTSSYNFILSCDTPYIHHSGIDFILSQCKGHEITMPVSRGIPQPLFAVFSKECLPRWESLLGRGILKLQDMASHFQTKFIDVDPNPLFDSNFFMNINTPAQFAEAENQFQLKAGYLS